MPHLALFEFSLKSTQLAFIAIIMTVFSIVITSKIVNSRNNLENNANDYNDDWDHDQNNRATVSSLLMVKASILSSAADSALVPDTLLALVIAAHHAAAAIVPAAKIDVALVLGDLWAALRVAQGRSTFLLHYTLRVLLLLLLLVLVLHHSLLLLLLLLLLLWVGLNLIKMRPRHIHGRLALIDRHANRHFLLTLAAMLIS